MLPSKQKEKENEKFGIHFPVLSYLRKAQKDVSQQGHETADNNQYFRNQIHGCDSY